MKNVKDNFCSLKFVNTIFVEIIFLSINVMVISRLGEERDNRRFRSEFFSAVLEKGISEHL